MENILNHIKTYPAIPVFYHDDLETCIAVVDACYRGGIRVFEFVHRGEKAVENFEALLAYKKKHLIDLKLGIGTIKTPELAKTYVKLGAEFIVSPVIVPAIAKETLEKGILWIPGCMTPTEIAQAEAVQAPLVKLFPGDTLGPNFLKSIKPLFPNTKFMPTGGVDVEENNIDAWFKAGVYAVGLGSKLFQAPPDATNDEWLSERCKLLLSWVQKKG
ncbi:bifunctional 4-hydroxy-2-oxoglutarate aldolase/2-dehydro-3-deoxy-phosphogluconate aldolase [Sphingobacterium psychroaquaticum]|uniref:bifunctional 4-hydroxy-2-oxoglutarate aldolase/2-dehydro-3-deoxy-phosphogluconate aldolase n=1 Tax=Sphingobacterium psychroaquaticum TaxID=561061 RepID=UPI00106C080B|nr:bifunctional 4-hydroxy-2-oxoglutarate aldolase/2-dehydro-3-deoxy-phosphogluconate aldolase [Sphingobacterium psychroaquaticum]QBQ40128.1 bifunctional 4-hydroxy-2-oxoglutarate aldolase/2-dehydro-3-deoxy-phosphogluconate aldolase [Sphingobacterium psychroaquaticum]